MTVKDLLVQPLQRLTRYSNISIYFCFFRFLDLACVLIPDIRCCCERSQKKLQAIVPEANLWFDVTLSLF